ncbi:hypothetical protein FBZ82_12612 [Azospirillum brasilense]|uniref:Uncharacterized protein n=1 Tax=Azospirillum brasilense TaxID=192 RepID=A0A560AFV7_AZOBR|nr:hypothetical protein FBZ82_12612 [Azospirillum brasilense]
MPSHAQSVPTQSRNARPVRRVGKKANPSLRTIERSRAPSPALAEALDAVSAFAAAPAYRRRAIERTVEALLTILDHMDGDPDLESQDEGADEFEDMRELWASPHADGPGDPDDAECNGDLELDLCDREPEWGEDSLQPNHHLSAALERPSNLFVKHQPVEARHG